MKRRRAFLLLAAILMCTSSIAQNNTDFRLNTIVIDPGHGGKDPGALSQDKRTREKDLTLAISKKLSDKIRKEYPEMKVVLTRDKDVFVALSDRAAIATKNNANLFVSVHINAASNRSANGFSAYILGQSSNKNSDTYAFNMEVVKRENSVIYLEDNYARYGNLDSDSPESQILSQFMYNAFREQSLSFAETVNGRMTTPFKKSGGVHQANFAVLRLASMPAVLLELGFISNSADLTILRNDKEIDRMVDNLFKAFCEYKSGYDASMGVPQSTPEPTKPEPAPKQEAKPESGQKAVFHPAPIEDTAVNPDAGPAVTFGTQVLATSKTMSEKDPYFLGYDVRCVKAGSLNKYIIGMSEDPEEARKMTAEIRKKYKDAFTVKIEGGTATLMR